MKNKTELGLHVQSLMATGKLVDPKIIIKLLRNSLQNNPGKYIFVDGFPRSVQNCKDFMAICGRPEFVIWLDTSDQILIERIMQRAARGDNRPDDNLESVKKRLKVYHESGMYMYMYVCTLFLQ